MSQPNETWDKLGQDLSNYQPDGPREAHFEAIQKQLSEDGFAGNSTPTSIAGWLSKWILGGLGLMAVVAVSWAIVSNANTMESLSERISSDDFNIGDASNSSTDVVSNELGVASQESSINRLEGAGQNEDSGINNQNARLETVDQRLKGFLADQLTDTPRSSDGQQAGSSDGATDTSSDQNEVGSSLPPLPNSGDSDDRPASSGFSEGGLEDSEGRYQPTAESTYGLAVLDNRFPPAEVLSEKTDSLEISPVNLPSKFRKPKKRRFSFDIGSAWHLRQTPDGKSAADPGLSLRLSYELPIGQNFGLRLYGGFRYHQKDSRRPWIVYEEELTRYRPQGLPPLVTAFTYEHNHYDARGIGAELLYNFSRCQARFGLMYARMLVNSSASTSSNAGSMDPLAVFSPTVYNDLARLNDWALTAGFAYRLFPRWRVYTNIQYGLIDLSPDEFWENPKRETSDGIEIGISYSF
ncbi:MAG: hypothetical protein AAF741_14450 [Bacteroidota bacterium]